MNTLKKASVALAIGILGLGLGGGLATANDAMTLHVEISSDSTDGEDIKMAMPINLIAAMADSMNVEDSITTEIFDEFESEGFDLRNFWQQVKDGDINEFFNLEVEDASIKAWRENGMFRLSVSAEEGGSEVAGRDRAMIEVSLPEDLMDFLVASEGAVEPSDLVTQLRSMGPMTLVSMETDKESIKIWMD